MVRSILGYGLGVALVLLIFKGAEHFFYTKQISIEIYVSILALMFTAIGVWFGLKYTRPKLVVTHQMNDHIDSAHLKSHGISDREIEVLKLVILGKTNQQIANDLFISLSTVKTHLQNVYQKLDVSNRTQAIQAAKILSASRPKV